MTRLLTTAARLALLLWVGLSLLGPAFAQRKGIEALAPAPPPPQAKSITLRPGETVPVELGIHGSRAQQLEFVVRTQPKKGKLSAVQKTGINSGVVQYRAGKEAGQDRFTYAVQNADGVSAPAAVTITIVEPVQLPARLVAQEALEFPEIVIGGQSTGILELENKGGEMAVGELSVPDGWVVEGTTRYELNAGKKAVFKLVFAPTKEGEFIGNAVFGPKPQRAVVLRGVAKAPMAVTPAQLELAAPQGSQTRSGMLRLENRTGEERKVGLTAGARVLTERVVAVPPGGSVEVKVLAAADDAGALDDKLKLESAGWTAEVPVKARAIAAMVKFSGALPDFGAVVAGVPVESFATLENPGGLPVTAALRVEAPFEVSSAGVPVPARGSVKIPVKLLASGAGNATGTLVADTGNGSDRLALAVDVAPQPQDPPPATPSAVVKAAEAPAAKTSVSLPPPIAYADAPGNMGKYIRDITSDSAVMEWPVTLGPSADLMVHLRVVTKGADGFPAIAWKPLPKAKISESGGMRRAELEDLDSSQLYVVKATSKGETIFTTKFVTRQGTSIFNISMQAVVIALLLAVLVFTGWWRWKKRVRSAW